MEQPNEQPIESVQSSKNIWIIAISIIVTALIVGGGVYAWQRSSLNNTEQNLQQQISVLQNQISQLQQVQNNQNQLTNPQVVEQDNQPITNPQQDNYKQPVDPTANWKTYKNNKYG